MDHGSLPPGTHLQEKHVPDLWRTLRRHQLYSIHDILFFLGSSLVLIFLAVQALSETFAIVLAKKPTHLMRVHRNTGKTLCIETPTEASFCRDNKRF